MGGFFPKTAFFLSGLSRIIEHYRALSNIIEHYRALSRIIAQRLFFHIPASVNFVLKFKIILKKLKLWQ